MRHSKGIIAAWLALGAAVVSVQAGGVPKPRQAKTPAQIPQAAPEERGQQVFNQNCSRCHNPPEGFPPSVSEAIAKHMRVRAGLSAEDYKALLRFLNP